jgi:hypothetical protein
VTLWASATPDLSGTDRVLLATQQVTTTDENGRPAKPVPAVCIIDRPRVTLTIIDA